MRVHARDKNFSFTLDLAADAPIALQGEAGFSRKSDAGQASHYYSQPFFKADGVLSLNGREMKVVGRAWMDHEWSSQPLAPDQKGWDWFSLHLAGGEKLMLFRLRSATAAPFLSGNWIAPGGAVALLPREDILLEPLMTTPLCRARIADALARQGQKPWPRYRDGAAQPAKLDGSRLSLLGGADPL